MKTRSAIPESAPNIAAIVKARHHARVSSPSANTNYQQFCFPNCSENNDGTGLTSLPSVLALQSSLNAVSGTDDTKFSTEDKQRNRSDGGPRLFREAWSADDRRLFFQAIRLYGRNFTEITRFIRSRGHRITSESSTANLTSSEHTLSSVVPNSSVPPLAQNSSAVCSGQPGSSAGLLPLTTTVSTTTAATSVAAACSNASDLATGRTREQVRLFYWQTWQKIRRYLKFPECVPQHVREVYALINYSVFRARIKKPLDHRLGEKLNELILCGSTAIRHNGRRFLLRTPACQALKQLNNITAPPHEFLLPEDVWVELVPLSQADLWRVLEAEQNPRVRLRVDLNRQLSDVVRLVETKWQLAAERMQTLFDLPVAQKCHTLRLLVRISPSQAIDGAIRLQEVPRVRSGDVALRSYIQRQSAMSKSSTSVTGGSGGGTPSDSAEQPSAVTACATSRTIPESSDSTECVPSTSNSGTQLSSTHLSSNAPPLPPPAAELDLRKVGKQLREGVTYETSRGLKILTLFLALGCPERIRFEYSFVPPKPGSCSQSALLHPSSSSTSLYRPPQDIEGQGISNGLRRLLHLNASDYLLHRDWLCSQSALSMASNSRSATGHPPSINDTPGRTASSGAASTIKSPISLNTQVPVSTVAVIPPCSSLAHPTSATQPAVITRSDGASAVRLTHVNATSVPPTTSLTTLVSSTAGQSPAVSQLPTLPPSSSVVIFPKPISMVGRVPVVERQLDLQRGSQVTNTTSPILKIPISRYSPCGVSHLDSSVLSTNIPSVSVLSRATPTTTVTTFSAPTPLASPNPAGPPIRAHRRRRREVTISGKPRQSNQKDFSQLSTISTTNSPGPARTTFVLPQTRHSQKLPIASLSSFSMLPASTSTTTVTTISAHALSVSPAQSSLSAIKAHSHRRREPTISRGPRRINPEHIVRVSAPSVTTSPTITFAYSPKLPIASLSSISVLPRLSSATTITTFSAHTPSTAPSAQSSLSAIKAHNRRRRETTIGRGPRRVNPKDILQLSNPSVTQTGRSPKLPIPNLNSASNTIRPAAAPAARPYSVAFPSTPNRTTCFTQAATTATTSAHTPAVCLAGVATTDSPMLSDGDISLSHLLDPGASNQSSLSALSTDTLASLWNTICHPSVSGNSQDVPNLCGLTPTMLNTDTPLVPNFSTNPILCKQEDTVDMAYEDGNSWMRLPDTDQLPHLASTPSIPPESPAFGDISLTDSMAAAVMDTHRYEPDSSGFGPPSVDDPLAAEFSNMHPSAGSNHGTILDTKRLTTQAPQSGTSNTFMSGIGTLLRVVAGTSPTSFDPSTIDLNSLMQAISATSPTSTTTANHFSGSASNT